MAAPPKRLKIVIVEDTGQIGGAQVNSLQLQERLDPARFETLTICPEEGPLTRELARVGARFEVRPSRRFLSTSTRLGRFVFFNPLAVLYDVLAMLPRILAVRAVLRREKAALVMTNGMLAHFYGGLAARLAAVPCVWHVDDIIQADRGLGAALAAFRLAARLLPGGIIVPSRAVKSSVLEGAGLAEKTAVIYNAFDAGRFDPARVRSSLRAELGIAADSFVVGIFSRLTRWKGHAEFVRAARLVAAQMPAASFLVVGGPVFEDDACLREVRELVRRLGLEKAFAFAGFRRDTPECMASVDVCVLPSIRPEPFGLVLVEAMAMGKPVIATRGGGVPEVVADGETGILVPPRDPGALADALLRLAGDQALRARMGAAGRARAVSLFSLERFVREHEREFARIASA
jgi:glycosyltransferase involved in cell wall biosynthesis